MMSHIRLTECNSRDAACSVHKAAACSLKLHKPRERTVSILMRLQRLNSRLSNNASKSIVMSASSDEGNNNNETPVIPKKRLVPFILSVPRRIDRYFDEKNIARRVAWCGISAGAGFYAGNIVTLTFGALAINDVFAGIVTLIFYEVVTTIFYSTPNPSLKLWFANYFKIGVVVSMLADAVKLGG